MSSGTRSEPDAPESEGVESVDVEVPEVAVCESAPGTTVFLESGNTDGWLASDVTVDVVR